MSTAIAILSGKGGSGKTTLALSIADLLCRCEVKTLLVDCDLSTNGATYFYESKLNAKDKTEQSILLSFEYLLNFDNSMDKLLPLKIREGLDFVPSVLNISDQHPIGIEELGSCDTALYLQKFVEWAQKNYEVVLFDCQAGYVEFLPMLLPLMNVDLFVMEADSISASAIRSLHLKIGKFFGRARLYQVFNKATSVEYDIYSKIVGTFFTNIGTLLFDWKIRQAFSRSQVPDLENVSAQYGSDLCNICKIILTENAIREKLTCLSYQLLYHHLENEREQTIKELDEFTDTDLPLWKELLRPVGVALCSLVSVVCIVILMLNTNFLDMNMYATIASVFLILYQTVMFGIIAFNPSSPNPVNEDRQKCERRLKEIDKKLEKLNYLQKNDQKQD